MSILGSRISLYTSANVSRYLEMFKKKSMQLNEKSKTVQNDIQDGGRGQIMQGYAGMGEELGFHLV